MTIFHEKTRPKNRTGRIHTKPDQSKSNPIVSIRKPERTCSRKHCLGFPDGYMFLIRLNAL